MLTIVLSVPSALTLHPTPQLTVIPLGCTQLYSMYVGEGEQNLRDAFRRARLAAPSIVFLDEIDALAPKREEVRGGGAATWRQVAWKMLIRKCWTRISLFAL